MLLLKMFSRRLMEVYILRKETIGERVEVTANIFGDGHDHIRAEVLYNSQEIKTGVLLK